MAEFDQSFASNSVPEVRNKAPKAPGLMPKNAQTWVIVTISAVMILVIAFSNSGAPKAQAKAGNAAQQSATLPNPRQIDQYRTMVDEEARKLALERQKLDQVKTDAQNAAAGAQMPPSGQGPYQPQGQPAAYNGPEIPPGEAQRIALEAERKKREYNSLFSSNVALSLRKEQNSGQGSAAGQDPQSVPALLQTLNSQLSALRQSPQNPPLQGTAAQLLPSVPQQPSSESAGGGAVDDDKAEPLKPKRKEQAGNPARMLANTEQLIDVARKDLGKK